MPDKPIEVLLPKPEALSLDQKISLATEIAFDALVAEAGNLGLGLRPAMPGLENTPDLEAIKAFKAGCRAIFASRGSEWLDEPPL